MYPVSKDKEYIDVWINIYPYEDEERYYKYVGCFATEKDFIHWIAEGYYGVYDPNARHINDEDTTYFNHRFDGHVYAYDGYDRQYIPNVYKEEAWRIYKNEIENKRYKDKRWIRSYHGGFRSGNPIKGISKWRGGRDYKPISYKHYRLLDNIKELQPFNRGGRSSHPISGYDRYRSVERNWKSQSKRRHQWKEKV